MTPIIWPTILATFLALLALGVAYGKTKDGKPPGRLRIATGVGLATTAVVPATALIPALPWWQYAAALTAVLTAGAVVIHAVSCRAIGWASLGEVLWAAYTLPWSKPRRALAAVAALIVAGVVGSWLASKGATAHGVLAALIALAPARWYAVTAWKRERTRTRIERALAGVLTGGQEWNTEHANLRGAPIRVRWDDHRPLRILAPIPPAWKHETRETFRREVQARLAEWGTPWIVQFNPSKRRMTAVLDSAVPDKVTLPGDRTWEWMKEHAPSSLAFYLGEGQDVDSGVSAPLWWDPDATDPHALIGGKTKSGKSVSLVLLVAQAVERGWDVIICDPKGVDFAWAGRLPGVRLFTKDECVEGLSEAYGEMRERQEWLQKALWAEDGNDEEGDLLKVPGQPFKPCLVIIDEAAEAAAIGDKERRELTAEQMSSLARLSRFAGMVCAFATQRPDAKFLTGETKANLGTRVLFGDAGSLLTSMVLDVSKNDLSDLTGHPRGRARAVISDRVFEFQGAFVSKGDVKELAGGLLDPDKVTAPRHVPRQQWHGYLSGSTAAPRVEESTETVDESERAPVPVEATDRADVNPVADGQDDDETMRFFDGD